MAFPFSCFCSTYASFVLLPFLLFAPPFAYAYPAVSLSVSVFHSTSRREEPPRLNTLCPPYRLRIVSVFRVADGQARPRGTLSVSLIYREQVYNGSIIIENSLFPVAVLKHPRWLNFITRTKGSTESKQTFTYRATKYYVPPSHRAVNIRGLASVPVNYL